MANEALGGKTQKESKEGPRMKGSVGGGPQLVKHGSRMGDGGGLTSGGQKKLLADTLPPPQTLLTSCKIPQSHGGGYGKGGGGPGGEGVLPSAFRKVADLPEWSTLP